MRSLQGQMNVDRETGKVRVWDVENEKYILRYPIDVREGLKVGSLSLHAPEDTPEAQEKTTIEDVMEANLEGLREICAMNGIKGNLDKFQTLDEARNAVAKALGLLKKPESE